MLVPLAMRDFNIAAAGDQVDVFLGIRYIDIAAGSPSHYLPRDLVDVQVTPAGPEILGASREVFQGDISPTCSQHGRSSLGSIYFKGYAKAPVPVDITFRTCDGPQLMVIGGNGKIELFFQPSFELLIVKAFPMVAPDIDFQPGFSIRHTGYGDITSGGFRFHLLNGQPGEGFLQIRRRLRRYGCN